MDTGSHLLFGATLAGLAALHPVIAHQPELSHAIMAATLIGSHAPDFDTIARLKGYSAYIRIHRGITHSLPALLIWPVVLSIPVTAVFGVWEHAHLVWLWAFFAVVFHVFLDWFNAYGVQCFRPFSQKWHHLDVLSLFEPGLFLLHSAGLLLWLLNVPGIPFGWMFAGIYAVTFMYIGVRTVQHRQAVEVVRRHVGFDGVCHVLPGMLWYRWQFVVETESHFTTGTLHRGVVSIKDVYRKDAADSIVQATMSTDGVRAFLHFAQRVYVISTEQNDGYVVKWRDVRFWHNHQLPFGVDVYLDRNLNVVDQSLGWRKKVWDPPFV
ncbi:metal-dependent hydrolase [Paenibacillus sp. H1-7]|uniref:metal-dependent hydrolase n=1 Tax=Paenibacillus sp. H1-7 TaxID=2282849 RepID=UPI001EF857DC|nr:metal-dependent hydrolase [Paenibacillus sp. H1-7]ULL15723.1 metal-dependent hydrolase [Paenibacillus sp. H1-7]